MVSESPLRLEFTMHFERKPHGKKKLVAGETPVFVGHVPRVARVLALAHHFDHLIAQGAVKDYAEIARLSHMTRARVTQIMYLKYLAPDPAGAVGRIADAAWERPGKRKGSATDRHDPGLGYATAAVAAVIVLIGFPVCHHRQLW